MNKVELMGRLTRNPETRYSSAQDGTQTAITRYTLAVDRRMARQNQDGQQTADFIPCVCFGKTAEFAQKYFVQGIKIAIVGRIQTGSYTDKDGRKVYTTDVVVEEQEFAESKNQGQPQQPQGAGQPRSNPAGTPQQAPQQQPGGYYPQQAPQQQPGGYYPQQGGQWMDVPPGLENDLPFK